MFYFLSHCLKGKNGRFESTPLHALRTMHMLRAETAFVLGLERKLQPGHDAWHKEAVTEAPGS